MLLFVNRVTIIDSSRLDPEVGLTGESWLVDLELEGGLDEQGMLLDFSEVKRAAKQLIDAEFDHKLLVPERSPRLRIEWAGDGLELLLPLPDGGWIRHRSPANALALIPSDRIDAAILAEHIGRRLQTLLPANVQRVRLRLREETIGGAWYRYSHGLKQHCGNCQRIAHGHRSAIEIQRDGARDHDLEEQWARHWRDIYLGSRDDLLSEFTTKETPMLRFGYSGTQGAFQLEIPRARCDLLDTDSTVEQIARHIAASLAERHPGSHFLVRAFEGVDKGAVAEAG